MMMMMMMIKITSIFFFFSFTRADHSNDIKGQNSFHAQLIGMEDFDFLKYLFIYSRSSAMELLFVDIHSMIMIHPPTVFSSFPGEID